MPVVAGCPQIQPIQFPGDYYPGYVFFKFQKIFMGQAIQYQNAGEVCAVSGHPIL